MRVPRLPDGRRLSIHNHAVLGPAHRAAILAGLKGEYGDRLEHVARYAWWWLARDSQWPPDEPWSYWLLLAGRGSGKTRTGAEMVKTWAEENPGSIIHLIAPTAGDVEKVMLNGPAGLLKCYPPDRGPRWLSSWNKIIWPNATIGYTFSSQEPERLRGPQCGFAWCDEIAAWRNVQATTE